jgi:hypothetical protein
MSIRHVSLQAFHPIEYPELGNYSTQLSDYSKVFSVWTRFIVRVSIDDDVPDATMRRRQASECRNNESRLHDVESSDDVNEGD